MNALTAAITPAPTQPVPRLTETLDRAVHANMAQLTGGMSPAALGVAYIDWAAHLAMSPGKTAELAINAWTGAFKLANFAGACFWVGGDPKACLEPAEHDARFRDKAWERWPYSFMAQSFLMVEDWWRQAAYGVRGVSVEHSRLIDFTNRQVLDMTAPSNFVFTNPQVLDRTWAEGGSNLYRGWKNVIDDLERQSKGRPPAGAEAFQVGRDLALTPGHVVFRNDLMELIQYSPTTETVHPEPILIVPAWIMKYYILDLTPKNSMIQYLVGQGHTVFVVSWKNPDGDDRNIGFDDYRRLGVMAALDAIGEIIPDTDVHGVGYCLGGTLLGVAAGAMAGRDDDRFKTLTLLAAQWDFTEAGEIRLFVNDASVSFLEDMMWSQGYLQAEQMSGAFHILRSKELIWSRIVREYLLGERLPMMDLMAWNADSTRMPYRMHTEYLRNFFLNNDLADGRHKVDGKTVALTDIRAPIFAVGTEKDHVAPWRSVYKVRQLTDTDVTFVLTSGGHNAGIVSEPGHPRRRYRMATTAADDLAEDAEVWFAAHTPQEGSWWPAWQAWLADHSSAPTAPPPEPRWLGDPEATLIPAPGRYVFDADQ
ncbi:MAG: PHA/PHB synthase family protein [Maricaulaceae bacterium]